MATKFDKGVASDKKMLSTKSHNQLTALAHQVTWQIKKIISISTRPVQIS